MMNPLRKPAASLARHLAPAAPVLGALRPFNILQG